MKTNPSMVGVLLLLIGVGAGMYLVCFVRRSRAVRSWSPAKGKILRSYLDEDADGFAPKLEYSYEVSGIKYVGERLYYHTVNRNTESGANQHLSPYPVGRTVTLYFDPKKPSESVLKPCASLWLPIFWIGFSAFFIFMGVTFLMQ